VAFVGPLGNLVQAAPERCQSPASAFPSAALDLDSPGQSATSLAEILGESEGLVGFPVALAAAAALFRAGPAAEPAEFPGAQWFVFLIPAGGSRLDQRDWASESASASEQRPPGLAEAGNQTVKIS